MLRLILLGLSLIGVHATSPTCEDVRGADSCVFPGVCVWGQPKGFGELKCYTEEGQSGELTIEDFCAAHNIKKWCVADNNLRGRCSWTGTVCVVMTGDIPTDAPADEPGSDDDDSSSGIRPPIMIKARLNVAANKRGTRKGSYYTNSPMDISFKVNDEWTAEEPLFGEETCTQRNGGKCPKLFATYGPFDAEPSSVKVTLGTFGKKKRRDNMLSGALELEYYNERAGPTTSQSKCTAEMWELGKWLKGAYVSREYTPVSDCPCPDHKLKGFFNVKLMPDKDGEIKVTQLKTKLAVYYPCRDEWAEFGATIPKPGKVAKAKMFSYKNLPERPTKVKIKNIMSGTEVSIQTASFLIKPDFQSTDDRVLKDRAGDALVIAAGDEVEYPMRYSNMP